MYEDKIKTLEEEISRLKSQPQPQSMDRSYSHQNIGQTSDTIINMSTDYPVNLNTRLQPSYKRYAPRHDNRRSYAGTTRMSNSTGFHFFNN